MNQNMYGQPAPWGGLPSQGQPWSGGEQWEAAQQAPWRMSPWQTQGMPSGAGVQPAAGIAQAPSMLLPQGTSSDLPGFQPLQPGGGFYPGLLGGQQPQQPQAPQQNLWTNRGPGGGQVYANQQQATQAATQHNNEVASGGFGMGAGLSPTPVGFDMGSLSTTRPQDDPMLSQYYLPASMRGPFG